ncbi:hypothetical protein ACFSC4_23630 [Deinococcus malanensis]|uniref:hypothetical protein n=1 Tax=Deinococcus malanensis TaxID=1706855 RepID=UPI0027E58D6E|nr:hypothetical protein [Deinococcus malanensis]
MTFWFVLFGMCGKVTPLSSLSLFRTTCPYCAGQCNFELHLERNRPEKITPPGTARWYAAPSVRRPWPR